MNSMTYIDLNVFYRDIGAEESEIRVGFVTYGKEIHFYNVKVLTKWNRFHFCLYPILVVVLC